MDRKSKVQRSRKPSSRLPTGAFRTRPDLPKALQVAIEAAHEAGALMRSQLGSAKRIHSATQHDIKLELDVRCQRLIERKLTRAFPSIAVLGEEGVVGDQEAVDRWVVDPIDGTVNFTYGLPHAAVSIALQRRASSGPEPKAQALLSHETVLGVVYDPFCNELWTARRGRPARLNGRRIHVSKRTRLREAIVSIGFAKDRRSLRQTLPVFERLVPRVRKIRMMGSAALALTYVATGRMDAYLEPGIRLWDIAAGGMILESAGGDFWHEPSAGPAPHTFRIMVSNGHLRPKLSRYARLFQNH